MPPKRKTQKPKVKAQQTFYMPYQFRPIPLSLRPGEIEDDLEMMHRLLVSQRAALKRASLAPPPLPAVETQPPAQATPVPAIPVGVTAAAAAVATYYKQSAQLAVLLQQHHQHYQQQQLQQQQQTATAATIASAPAAVPAPGAGKLASPCTVQHQLQMHQQRRITGSYALA